MVQFGPSQEDINILAFQTGTRQNAQRNAALRRQRKKEDTATGLQVKRLEIQQEQFDAQLAQRERLAGGQTQAALDLQELRNQGLADQAAARGRISGSSKPFSTAPTYRPDILAGLKDGSIRVSPEQQREWSGFDRAEAWVNSTPTLNPQQKIAALNQIRAKRQAWADGLTEGIPQQEGNFEEEVAKNTFTDENGVSWYKTEDGFKPFQLSKSRDPVSATEQQDADDKRWNEALEFSKGDEFTPNVELARKIYNAPRTALPKIGGLDQGPAGGSIFDRLPTALEQLSQAPPPSISPAPTAVPTATANPIPTPDEFGIITDPFGIRFRERPDGTFEEVQ